MPFWDRNYGDRQHTGGEQDRYRPPVRRRAGGILRERAGRMSHDQHRMTGRGGMQGGERGRGGGNNQGRGSASRGGSRGGRR